MDETVKMLFLPIVGAIAIGIIFVTIVWAGNYQEKIVNRQGLLSGNVVKDLRLYDDRIGQSARCADVYDPVCGVDGRTYENLCFARQAGVDMQYQGNCR